MVVLRVYLVPSYEQTHLARVPARADEGAFRDVALGIVLAVAKRAAAAVAWHAMACAPRRRDAMEALLLVVGRQSARRPDGRCRRRWR